MDGHNDKKLNKLLANWPHGTVVTQTWLEQRNIYRQLANAYEKSGWIKKIGRGAYVRQSDRVHWSGGLYALQKQLGLSIHVAAQTALNMKGFAHYLELGENRNVMLFGTQQENLPAWFSKATWPENIVYISTNLFNENSTLGLTQSGDDTCPITLSTPERAMMELIFLASRHASYDDVQLAMESLTTLRPKIVKILLEECNSIKVKRFFMWLAEFNQHNWVKKLNLENVDFGKGKRTLFKGGVFNKKYQITVPKYN